MKRVYWNPGCDLCLRRRRSLTDLRGNYSGYKHSKDFKRNKLVWDSQCVSNVGEILFMYEDSRNILLEEISSIVDTSYMIILGEMSTSLSRVFLVSWMGYSVWITHHLDSEFGTLALFSQIVNLRYNGGDQYETFRQHISKPQVVYKKSGL